MAESFGVVVDLNVNELLATIEQYTERGGNLRDVAERSAAILKTAVDDIFATEGGASASQEVWKKSARAEEQGGMTLSDNGILSGSISTEFGDNWVLVGSNIPYGKFHLPPEKSGHDVTTGIMPVRDWLDIPEDEVFEEIADLMLDHLAG